MQTPGKSDTIKKISMEKGKRNMEVTFESLGLSEAMLKALEEKGYGYPTTCLLYTSDAADD